MQSRLPSALLTAGRNALSILGREALRIVLPSWCIVCGSELPLRGRTASCCSSCWQSLPKISAPKCRSCALPSQSADVVEFLCLDCCGDPLPVDWCDAWGEYRGALEKLLHALKFKRHDFLDDALAGLLEETLAARGDLAFDCVVPVPMLRARERTRGYNQAELLARSLSSRIGVPCDPLLRRRGGGTQSKLSRRERAANVKHAFEAADAVEGKAVLIVDDICTTGETLRACAAALQKAGAARVCAIAVAKAT